ncbi:MAG: hypothetical protein ABI254_05215 [Chthoniobacterales bacterium]
MTRSKQLPHTPQELEYLKLLVEKPPTGISDKKLRHLKILYALCKGLKAADIAKKEGITPQLVSKIKKEVIRDTLAVVLKRLLPKPKKHARPHAGRPGYHHFHEWLGNLKLANEPVYELTTLVLRRDVQLSTITIRETRNSEWRHKTRPRSSNENNLNSGQTVPNTIDRDMRACAKIPIFWTKVSMLDTNLKLTFLNLQKYWASLLHATPRAHQMEPMFIFPQKMTERFDNSFKHIILSAGQGEEHDKLVSHFEEGVKTHHINLKDRNLLTYLEGVLHHRRLTRSSPGLLATHWDLNSYSTSLLIKPDRCHHVWELQQSQMEQWLKASVLAQSYFAYNGVLTEMKHTLWNKIAFQENVNFRLRPLRTKVEYKEDHKNNRLILQISPLPSVRYETSVTFEKSATETAQAKKYCKAVRKLVANQQFVYSTRIKGEQTKNHDNCPMRFFRNRTISRTPVVLLPRHFLTLEPLLPIEELIALAKDTSATVSYKKLSVNSVHLDVIIFFLPRLKAAFLEKIRKKQYAMVLNKLDRCQLDLMEMDFRKSAQISGEKVSFTFKKFRAEKAKGESAWAEYRGAVGHEEVLRSLNNFTSKAVIVSNTEIEIFDGMIQELDGDFFLNELDRDSRKDLDKEATDCANACDKVLASAYWPGGEFNLRKAIALVGANLRILATQYPDEIESCCIHTRAKFSTDRKWVVRKVIETMQRCALRKLESVPIAIETTNNILSRWRAFTRKEIRGKLVDLTQVPSLRHIDIATQEPIDDSNSLPWDEPEEEEIY